MTSRSSRIRSLLVTSGLVATSAVVLTVSGTQAAEVGIDDFRVSDMGGEAQHPRIAFDPVTNRYLVVWRGDDEGDGQTEIYGQLIDASDGSAVSPDDFVIAQIGTPGDPETDVISPAVAYDSALGEFVVVYAGDDLVDPDGFVVDTFEIYAQRVSSAGSTVGAPLRVSDMGASDTADSFDAFVPDIAYNDDDNEFLVVWQGDDDTAPLVNNESEIFGQRIGRDGGDTLVEVGTNDFRISDMGVDGAAATDARDPAVAYNTMSGEYLVAWEGNDDAASPLTFRIWGQFLTATGGDIGLDNQLSETGDESYDPDIAINTNDGNYLLVWQGDDGASNDFEIYGQVHSSVGAELIGDTPISAVTPAGDAWIANTPAVAFDPIENEYLVTWAGDDSAFTVADEYEVFGKRVDATLSTVQGPVRLSAMGPDGVANATTSFPDVAFSGSASGTWGVVWQAENPPTTASGEAEIWGQFVAPEADLSITKSLTTPDRPAPGDPVTYQITYANTGPDTALGVIVTDVVPPGLTNVSVVGTPPVTPAGPNAWSVGALDPGDSGFITITANVDVAAIDGTVISNTATISSTSLVADVDSTDNSSTASLTVDAPPSVTIDQAPAQADPTNTNPVNFAVQFSEPVTGFDSSDVVLGGTLAGGATAVVTGSGATYDVAVSGLTGVGTISASISAGAAVDAPLGKPSLASTSTDNTVSFDDVAPTVTLNQVVAQADPANSSPVLFDVVFSEPVVGFTSGDVNLVTTGSLAGWTVSVSGSGANYTISAIGGTGEGTVRPDFSAGAATDAAGNGNLAPTSTDDTVTVDLVVPTVTIDQAPAQVDPTNASPIQFVVTFSEPVTGFADADVTLGGSAGATTAVVTGSGATYTVSVSGMTSDGTVTASIPAGTASDVAGNGNLASTSTDNTVTFDTTGPTVSIDQALTQVDPTATSPIEFTVTFSDPVTGFTGADVALSGSAGATTAVVTGSGATYTVTVGGMTGSGFVIASVPSGGAVDAAGNANAASTSTDNTVLLLLGDPNPATNDPPVNTVPGAQTAEAGQPLVFSSANGNAIAFFDPDVLPDDDVEVTVSVTAGTVTAATTAGLTSVTGDGTGTLTMVGTSAEQLAALNGLEFEHTDEGTVTLTFTVDDLGHTGAGGAQTDADTVSITVDDTVAPTITAPSSVSANTAPGQPGANVTFTVTATDASSSSVGSNVGGAAVAPTVVCTPASGSFFPIGSTTVTCTATDAAGNASTASFPVNVTDAERPVLSAVADVSVSAPVGATSVVVNYTVPSATDNSGTATITCTPATGSTFAIGNTTVTCTASDPSGNTATSTFVVRVSQSSLPATGNNAKRAVSIAFAVLALGTLLLTTTRRRRTI